MLKRFLNPKRSWASRRVSLLHNLRLFVQTVAIAGLVTAAWYHCFTHSLLIRVSKDGDKVILTTSILVCAAIFAVVAALLFTQTADRTRELSKAVLLKDQQAFLIWRDEKIPFRMHLVLIVFSLSILVQLFVAEYETAAIGGLIIFIVTAVLVLYFTATLEMQDVSTSVWFRERIPPNWFEIKLDEHFQLLEVIAVCRGEKPKSVGCNISISAEQD